MSNDLFVKNVPEVIKRLVAREAEDNRRSVNQETIALIEEALLHRIGTRGEHARPARLALEDYVATTASAAVALQKGH